MLVPKGYKSANLKVGNLLRTRKIDRLIKNFEPINCNLLSKLRVSALLKINTHNSIKKNSLFILFQVKQPPDC